MSADRLLDSLSYIDPSYIEEASEKNIKKSKIGKTVLYTILPMAACALLIVGIAKISNSNMSDLANMSTAQAPAAAEDAAPMEEAAYESEAAEDAAPMEEAACESESAEDAAPMEEAAYESESAEDVAPMEEAIPKVDAETSNAAYKQESERKNKETNLAKAEVFVEECKVEGGDLHLWFNTGVDAGGEPENISFELYQKNNDSWSELSLMKDGYSVVRESDSYYRIDFEDNIEAVLGAGDYRICIFGSEYEFVIEP